MLERVKGEEVSNAPFLILGVMVCQSSVLVVSFPLTRISSVVTERSVKVQASYFIYSLSSAVLGQAILELMNETVASELSILTSDEVYISQLVKVTLAPVSIFFWL